jgi:hypothetical protein
MPTRMSPATAATASRTRLTTLMTRPIVMRIAPTPNRLRMNPTSEGEADLAEDG